MTTTLLSRLRSTAVAAVCLSLTAASSMIARAQQTPVAQPVIIADFNHDGIPDALIVSTTSPTATIAFGSVPYGTFAATSKAVTFPAACTSFPQGSLLAGDFNNDGLADIAFFCGTTEGVMLGNGDGTFGAPKLLDVGSSQLAVLGDFNKDGKLDIAVIGLGGDSIVTNNIQFLAGNGDGTFAATVLSPLSQQGFSTPVVADIDGDGYPDIALLVLASNFQMSASVSVFGNNKDGTFGVAQQGYYNASAFANFFNDPVEVAPSILAGNFFGNDVNDLIVPDTGTNPGLYLIQNNSTSGNFSLGDASKTAIAGLSAAAAGFFSGSGATDLVIANGATISVMDNDGSGNFATDYTALTIPSTTSLFAVADANGDGYSDIYTATSTNGALSLSANVTTGSATATSKPFSLGVGTSAISAAWNGNVNLLASTATGQQIVTGAVSVATVTSSKNPSLVGDSVTFNVAVASSLPSDTVPTGTVVLSDGTTTLASGTLDGTGAFSYTTTALTQATHLITATYPGDNYFAASTSPVLSQVVNHAPAVVSNINWATPAAIVYGTALSATQLNATAVDANGVTIPGTFTYSPAAGTVPGIGTQTLSVSFVPTDAVDYTNATGSVKLVVVPPNVGATITAPSTTPPGSQTSLTVALAQPYPVDLVATLAVAFVRSGTPQLTDPSLQLACQDATSNCVLNTTNTTLSFTVPANTTTVPVVLLQAGTIAGTITVPLTLTAGGVNVTPTDLPPVTIVVPPAVPTVSGMTVTRSGGQLTVVMHGFSNTREVVNAKFHFTAAPGATLGTSDLTLPADTIFNANWFNTIDSDVYGSTFTYTQIFNTSDGAANIGSVDATLSNTVGASTTTTAK